MAPEWLVPAGAVQLDHTGPTAVGLTVADGQCTVELAHLLDTAVVLLPNAATRATGLPAAWAALARDGSPPVERPPR